MDPITWIKKKALPVMKEVAMVTVIYAGAVIGQYLMDFLQVRIQGSDKIEEPVFLIIYVPGRNYLDSRVALSF
jgi:hypothetical protein